MCTVIRDVHRNFEGQLLCPEKKGQHVNFCHRRRHAPVPWTHMLPISLETLTNRRRHAPVPVPLTHILPISRITHANRRRHAPVPWTLIPRLFYLGLHEGLQP